MQGSASSSESLTNLISKGKTATVLGVLHTLHKTASAWGEGEMSSEIRSWEHQDTKAFAGGSD